MSDAPNLMNGKEARAYLRLGEKAFVRLVKSGVIPVWIDPDTQRKRYSRKALDRWLESNCRGVA